MIYRYVHLVEIQFYSPINISLLEIHYNQYCVMVTYILGFIFRLISLGAQPSLNYGVDQRYSNEGIG